MMYTPIRNVSIYVCESLAAADPYYVGPCKASSPGTDARIVQIDPSKTARDLGRVEAEVAPTPPPYLTGPVGGEGPEPTLDGSAKAEAL
jgi:hypothetical protein